MNGRAITVFVSASALLIPAVLSRSAHAIGLESIWIPIIFAFALGMTASWFAPNRLAVLFAAFLVGVPLSILLDVLIDWFAFSHGRNLFPLEIFGWVKIVSISGILGVFLGRVARSMGNSENGKTI